MTCLTNSMSQMLERFVRWSERRLRIYESDFGRRFGWYLELDGERLAALTDPVWDGDGQFWHRYTMTPLGDLETARRLATPEFWYGGNLLRFVFENREFGTRVRDALPGGLQVADDGTISISMRALGV